MAFGRFPRQVIEPALRVAEWAAEQLRNSPALRAIEQLSNSPTMRPVERLAIMPRLTSEPFGTAWNERLEAAVKRLERAEDINAKAPSRSG